MKYFSLALGGRNLCSEHLTIPDEFVRSRPYPAKEILGGGDDYAEVLGRLSPHHTLCGQQTGYVIDRHAPVCICLHFEAKNSGLFVKENECFRMNRKFSIRAVN
jgi:hypothetical protein